MKALIIIQTRHGFIAIESEAPATFSADQIDEAQCFDSIGGRYSSGGVIDAVRDFFAPNPEATELKPAA